MSVEGNSRKKPKNPSIEADRISQLPDPILCRIVSCLLTVDGAATCVLSSRWKNIWRSIPKLRFHDTLPLYYADSNHVKFPNFVNTVLILHNNTQVIEEFHLQCFRIWENYDVPVWISNAIMKGIKFLYFSVVCGPISVQLPSSLFNCETLELLQLTGKCILINVPTRCYFPKLKTLELSYVLYHDGQSITRLVSSCPCLESLYVIREEYDNVNETTISSSSLRNLRFRTLFYAYPAGVKHKLEIDCPALQSTDIDCPALQSADISVPPFIGFPTSNLSSKTLEDLVLGNLSLLGSASKICLPNLRTLVLHFLHCKYNEYLNKLIHSCTSLESLHIMTNIFEGDVVLNVSSTTLRVLHIVKIGIKWRLKLVLNAPALRCLDFYDHEMVDYCIGSLPSLEEASIESNFASICRSTYQAIQNVKILSIEETSSSDLLPEQGLPMFHKLTVLKVEYQCCRWKVLQEFIKNSNKLEDLTLIMNSCGKDKHESCWKDFERVPKCLISSLSRMTILGIKGLEDELEMVKYFLKNSRAMDTMKIEVSSSVEDETKIKLLEKLLEFGRGCDNCKIFIS